MAQNVILDIQQHCDEVKGRGKPRLCAHCGAETEGGPYCETCSPFYREEDQRSEYQAMMLFKQRYASNIWAASEGRLCLYLIDNDPGFYDLPMLRLKDVEARELVESWHYAPSVDELAAAAMGGCTCKPDGNACPTCAALSRMTDGDELPF